MIATDQNKQVNCRSGLMTAEWLENILICQKGNEQKPVTFHLSIVETKNHSAEISFCKRYFCYEWPGFISYIVCTSFINSKKYRSCFLPLIFFRSKYNTGPISTLTSTHYIHSSTISSRISPYKTRNSVMSLVM